MNIVPIRIWIRISCGQMHVSASWSLNAIAKKKIHNLFVCGNNCSDCIAEMDKRQSKSNANSATNLIFLISIRFQESGALFWNIFHPSGWWTIDMSSEKHFCQSQKMIEMQRLEILCPKEVPKKHDAKVNKFKMCSILPILKAIESTTVNYYVPDTILALSWQYDRLHINDENKSGSKMKMKLYTSKYLAKQNKVNSGFFYCVFSM